MSKRKRKTNETTIKNKLKQGRGVGVLDSYKPWLHIQDVPSKGLSTRIKGLKTGRVHHLLSKLELSCFLCLDWSEKVIDIREQYPLYLLETLALAKKLNIRHPKVPKTNENVVMTTDFLVTLSSFLGSREVAISVKYANDLNNLRSIKKLEIERFYWNSRNIEWRIVTENQINPDFVSNIKWVRSYINIKSFFDPVFIEKSTTVMSNLICDRNLALRDITNFNDEYFDFEIGTSLAIVRYLIATRQWIVNMEQLIQPEKPLLLINQSVKGGI
jgi:hypothetical protein